jgi:hypothetical protein
LKYRCLERDCNVSCDFYGDLLVHLNDCHKKGNFTCPCRPGKVFQGTKNFRAHLTNKKPCSEAMCHPFRQQLLLFAKVSAAENAVKREVQEASGIVQEQFWCPFPDCMRNYTEEKKAKRHFLESHKESGQSYAAMKANYPDGKVPAKLMATEFTFDECGANFKTATNLKRHKARRIDRQSCTTGKNRFMARAAPVG